MLESEGTEACQGEGRGTGEKAGGAWEGKVREGGEMTD